jgi:hypothetical protein
MEESVERVRFCRRCNAVVQWEALRCKTCGMHLGPPPGVGPAPRPAPLLESLEVATPGEDFRLPADPDHYVRVLQPWPSPDLTLVAADLSVDSGSEPGWEAALAEMVEGRERRIEIRDEGDPAAAHAQGPVAYQVIGHWIDSEGRRRSAYIGRLPTTTSTALRERLGSAKLHARVRILFARTEVRQAAMRVDLAAALPAEGRPAGLAVHEAGPQRHATRARRRWGVFGRRD